MSGFLSGLFDSVANLPAPIAYVAIAALVFAEAALFVGFLVPGETAVLLGGALAATGKLSLVVVAVIVVMAAIVGDSVGYEVGRRFGTRLLDVRLLRGRRVSIDAARTRLQTKGAVTVFVGRFTAVLRALTPALCGMSRMPYRRFIAWNAAGGLAWGVGVTTLGYLAGRSSQVVTKSLGGFSVAILLAFIVVIVVAWHRRRRADQAPDANLEEAHERVPGADTTSGSRRAAQPELPVLE